MNSSSSQTLGALAINTSANIAGPVMTQGGRALSIRGTASLSDLTPGDGPISVYMTDKSLSTSEFEAYLEAGGPVSEEDTTAVEIATRGRRVRFLGTLIPAGNGTVAALSFMNESLSGLRFTKLSAGWAYFLYNEGRAMTTGSRVRITDSVFIRWDLSV